jgi:putative oxidoreductase
MKIAVIIVRIVMGLLFLMASLIFFFKIEVPQPVLTGNVKIFMEGILASGYLLPLIKVTELLCAIAFLSGRFVALATVVIFPVTLNIFLDHLFLAPEGLPLAIFLLVGNLFLAYVYRKNYEPLLSAK